MNMSLRQGLRPWRATTTTALVALATMSGCATMGEKTAEQQVQQRATAFWDARLKADPKAAYALLVPAYRDMRSQKDFIQENNSGISAQKVEVGKVTCEEEKCTVRIAITGKPSVPGLQLPSVTSYMNDTWVLDQGQWWRYQAP